MRVMKAQTQDEANIHFSNMSLDALAELSTGEEPQDANHYYYYFNFTQLTRMVVGSAYRPTGGHICTG